jgi:hypothetical protein
VRILLISANTEKLKMPTLPLGLSLVAAAVRRAGHAVDFLDLPAEADPFPKPNGLPHEALPLPPPILEHPSRHHQDQEADQEGTG